MNNLPCLKHLKIEIRADVDIMDGNAWEQMTANLVTFDFSFRFTSDFDEDIHLDLTSFRTPFWLEEKRWFVYFGLNTLYSISCAPVWMSTEFAMSEHTTAPDSQVLFDHIHNLVVKELSTERSFHCSYVNRLTLKCRYMRCDLASIIDLAHVRHLIISSFQSIQVFGACGDQLENLSTLSISIPLRHFLDWTNFRRLEKIRTLEIAYLPNGQPALEGDQIDVLCGIFPRLEKLSTELYCGIDQMLSRVKKFECLSTVAFCCISKLSQTLFATSIRSKLKASLDQAIANHQLGCTYRFDSNMCHLWLSEH